MKTIARVAPTQGRVFERLNTLIADHALAMTGDPDDPTTDVLSDRLDTLIAEYLRLESEAVDLIRSFDIQNNPPELDHIQL